MLRVCIDTNIWLSGIVFSGVPGKIVEMAFAKKFHLVSSTTILEEIERNLIGKFEVETKNVKQLIYRISEIADVYEPTGSVSVIPNGHVDNMILESALLGKAQILVTGDKKHLLPLRAFEGIKHQSHEDQFL